MSLFPSLFLYHSFHPVASLYFCPFFWFWNTNRKVSFSPCGNALRYDTSIRRTRKRNYDNYKPLRTVDSRSPLIDSLSEPLLASPSKSIDLAHAADTFSENIRTYGGSVEVEVDNSTSPDNTILRCMCPDRKGILYDFFRLLSDVTLKASYGRVATSNSMCEALVFVKDSKTGGQIDDKKVQKKLKDLITRNIAKPFQLFLTASPKAYCLEVKIVAPVDTSGRGRPKVIFDVTSALNGFDEVRILEAEMYTVGKPSSLFPSLLFSSLFSLTFYLY